MNQPPFTRIGTRIGIVADDLTSATDGAAPFLAKGFAPMISRGDPGPSQAALRAVDTNSRAMTAEQAARSTSAAVAALRDRSILFKTIDSTLRGHIREEIAAAFSASGRKRLVIAPAFPDAGRLTIDGTQYVHGVPVSESDYSRDPVHPARTSQIAKLLDPALGTPLVLPVNAPEELIRSAAGARIVILDADSQAALDRQVARIGDPGAVLWVGSPGLAIALAELVIASGEESLPAEAPNRRVLVVAGSANPVTHAQCAALQAGGVPVVEDLADAPSSAPIICLRAPQQRLQDAALVLNTMATQAATTLAAKNYDVVIATGGETMSAIFERLGISAFRLVRELEPGFPVGLAEQPDGSAIAVAMKAGGFGSPSTLLDAAKTLLAKMESTR